LQTTAAAVSSQEVSIPKTIMASYLQKSLHLTIPQIFFGLHNSLIESFQWLRESVLIQNNVKPLPRYYLQKHNLRF